MQDDAFLENLDHVHWRLRCRRRFVLAILNVFPFA